MTLSEKNIEDNLKLVYFVVHKWYNGNEDYISIGTIGLIKGLRSYDSSRGSSLSTYLVQCIKNEIAYSYRIDKNPKETLSLDYENEDTVFIDAISDGTNIEEDLIKKEEKELLYVAIHNLNMIEQYIIINYYGLYNCKKKMLKEIAFDLGMKPNKITKLHIKTLKKLKKYLKEGDVDG